MIDSIKVVLSVLLITSAICVSAQKCAVYEYGDNTYLKGLELYEKEKYGAARHEFEKLLASTEGSRSEIRSEAAFYLAMSAVELRNDDSEYLVFSFISEYPESPHVDEAAFRLADYFYDKNSWAKCISWYNRVDRFSLNRGERAEYHFKKGFAYYQRNDFEQARVNFYEILEEDSPYTAPATYYYSHIHYTEENYETALMGFRKIVDDPLFSNIAPYYIAQILYMQKKYDEVIEFTPPLMESVSDKRLGEMSKITGESFFMLDRYSEAIPYLETYRDNAGGTTIHDRYQLAFAYYMNQEYDKARELFEQISYRKTEIAQSAHYHLADCYLHLGDKNKARIAFSQAAKMDFDLRIQQDALFNYAKVTYELSYNPFNEAIRAFEEYIRLYPAAENTDEAYNYLVNAYLGTRNYSMALASLDRIRQKGPEIEKAYQKVAFYRGLELYKNLRFTEAVDAFEKSLKYAGYDPAITARTYFWLGEAAYRSGDPNTAQLYYTEFLDDGSASGQEEYALCHYSMGYIYFDAEKFDDAMSWFNRYIRLEQDKKAPILSDAYNRMADCYFVKKDYGQAMEFYDRCIASGQADTDYAMFQKGFTLGLLDRPQQKVEVLTRLTRDLPESNFVDDALFEIGRSYVVLNEPTKAQQYYQALVTDHPNSSYANKALNQLGLIYYNEGDYERALSYYQQVATNYPGTPEADNALTSIKNIYVRRDNVDGYMSFVNSLGRDITRREQDSLTYTAAEMVYTRGDCAETVRAFKDYLDAFPRGRFLLNAHYYKADCQLKLQQNEEALESLDYIINHSRNMFTEPALEAAAKINFRQRDYHRAIENYLTMLEVAEKKTNIQDAHTGLMRCYYELDEYANTIEAAREVLALDKLQEEIRREANFKIAKSFNALNEKDFAYDHFRKVSHEVNSLEGAESKYRVIEILFDRGEIDAAEEEVYEFIEMNTPHQYWMGMAFLTLSDIYIAKGDEFSAINSLQSLIDYYTIPDDGIIANAKQRKAALTEQAESDIVPGPENPK
ncbi:MAG TPA: tetratricopeptide repeat protein [Bacteroides sp.]|nr:tetratricopeptide repeat protein [Bacteroides sp.]